MYYTDCFNALILLSLQPQNPCIVGCTLGNQLQSLMTDIPHNPVGPPSLIQGDGDGRYTVDLSDAVPDIVDGRTSTQTAFPVVAFLFRLEEVNSHDVSFIWMVRFMVSLFIFAIIC